MTLYQPGGSDKPEFSARLPIAKLAETDDNADIAANSGNYCEECGGPTQSTDSEHTIERARLWLSTCREFHCCTGSNLRTQPPTRVIDVGPPDGRQQPRLRITTLSDEGMEYLTLSHCWGKEIPKKLLRSNFSEFIQGFAVADLPETFQDAIMICRRLGQRYLWIDSWCILQDDSEDWNREAVQMARVYGKSVCTIAALSSLSVNSGCFSVRNTLGHQPLLFKNRNGAPFIPTECGGLDEEKRLHHLDTRGWVFQERLLSPRTLGFASGGITWECSMLKASQRQSEGIPIDSMNATDVKVKEMFGRAATPLLPPLITDVDRRQFLMAWHELVHVYSQLSFTHQDDKLVAIAGVARALHKATGFNYHYGLWHDVQQPGGPALPAPMDVRGPAACPRRKRPLPRRRPPRAPRARRRSAGRRARASSSTTPSPSTTTTSTPTPPAPAPCARPFSSCATAPARGPRG